MKALENNGIKAFAVSYDDRDTLREFASKHQISYPLFSDEDSRLIRKLGILNTHIPEDHKWYGVPYPGTYMIDSDGVVFEKSFFASHGVRESVNDMLQEEYGAEDIELSPRRGRAD